MDKPKDIKVFVSKRDSICDECGVELGWGIFIALTKKGFPLCLTCADLDHLVYLPSGDAAVTRRAHKYSVLSAAVLKFSAARKRNERQGLLVESQALEKAENECLADAEARARRRKRAAEGREQLDKIYVKQFAEYIRKHYPNCPPGREVEIAEYACLKYSGRIGRSATAKEFNANAIKLSVIAHIRHIETNYEELLAEGYDRRDAREQIKEAIDSILLNWKKS